MYDFCPVSSDEVTQLIRHLLLKLSPLDCMPSTLFKSTSEMMAPLLARLANVSFSAVVFPLHYRLDHVVPLIKKSGLDNDDPANDWPITNLCTFSKMLKRLAVSRLQPHMMSSDSVSHF